MSTAKRSGNVVWSGNPWIVPSAIFRTMAAIIATAFFIWVEMYVMVASSIVFGLQLWVWTVLVFLIVWFVSLLELLILKLSNWYILMQDGLEIRQGIIRLRSFVVTPAGFGDLLVFQSVGGRIFGYGDLTVNSQGERQTKLSLVRHPFEVSDKIRDIMGRPLVRVENPS